MVRVRGALVGSQNSFARVTIGDDHDKSVCSYDDVVDGSVGSRAVFGYCVEAYIFLLLRAPAAGARGGGRGGPGGARGGVPP